MSIQGTLPNSVEAVEAPATRNGEEQAVMSCWLTKREKELRAAGLWETWKSVPPAEDRTERIEAYLPGGDHYDTEPTR